VLQHPEKLIYQWHGCAQPSPLGADSWEKDAKRGFITKVYSVLALQLGFTVLCCGASMYYDPVRNFMVGSGL